MQKNIEVNLQKFFVLWHIHFLTNVEYIWPHLDYTSLCIDYPVKRLQNHSNSIWFRVAKSYRVTEEA